MPAPDAQHGHQILIGIAKGINIVILYIAEVHVGYAVQEFCKAFVSLCNGRAEFVAVHVKIIEQPGEAAFGGRTLCGCFDMVKHTLQGFIQIFVVVGSEIDIAKQLGRKNKEALSSTKPSRASSASASGIFA